LNLTHYPIPEISPTEFITSLFQNHEDKKPQSSLDQEISFMNHMSKKFEAAALSKSKTHENKIKEGALPPMLNQIFTANWVLNASVQLTPPFTNYAIYGRLAFDFTTSGFAVSVTSVTGNIPMDVQFEFRIYPSMNGIEWLQVGPNGNDCYSYVFLQWLWTYFLAPFQIPFDSVPQQPVVVNGDMCSVWQTTYQWYGQQPSTLFVRNSDNALVQLTVPEPFLGHGMSIITLTNIVNSVNPNSYSRPATCVQTMKWNPSWNSHLPWYWCDPWC